jgi:AcrR family transcriptional regulator
MTDAISGQTRVNLRPEHPTALKLIDVTVEMIDAHGEVSVRVQDVVAAAGVQIPVLYRHFGNREGLIQAAHVRRMQNELASLLAAGHERAVLAKNRDEFLQTFDHLLDVLFGPARAEARFRRLSVVGSGYGRPEMEAVLVELQQEASGRLEELLKPAQDQGWIPATLVLPTFIAWLTGLSMSQTLIDLIGDAEMTQGWIAMSKKSAMAVLTDSI